jgi:hypothetical protein
LASLAASALLAAYSQEHGLPRVPERVRELRQTLNDYVTLVRGLRGAVRALGPLRDSLRAFQSGRISY